MAKTKAGRLARAWLKAKSEDSALSPKQNRQKVPIVLGEN